MKNKSPFHIRVAKDKSNVIAKIKNLSPPEIEDQYAILLDEYHLLHQEARQNTYKYQTLFDLNPEPVFVINLKGYVTEANNSAMEVTGFGKEEIIGRHFSRLPFFQENKLADYLKLFKGITQGKIQSLKNLPWEHKSDGIHYANVIFRLLKDINEKSEGVIVIAPEISPKNNKGEPDNSWGKIRIDTSKKAKCTVFADGVDSRIISANAHLPELLNIEEADLKHLDLKHWLYPKDYQLVAVKHHRGLTFNKNAVSNYQFRTLIKNGEPIWCEVKVIHNK